MLVFVILLKVQFLNSVSQLTETSLRKQAAGSTFQGQDLNAPQVYWVSSVNSFSVADAVPPALTR